MAKVDRALLVKISPLVSMENLGLAPLIGSEAKGDKADMQLVYIPENTAKNSSLNAWDG